MRRTFFLTPHVISTRIKKKKNSVQLSVMTGNNRLLQDLGHRNDQLMLLTGAVPVVNTNITILNKS